MKKNLKTITNIMHKPTYKNISQQLELAATVTTATII